MLFEIVVIKKIFVCPQDFFISYSESSSRTTIFIPHFIHEDNITA